MSVRRLTTPDCVPGPANVATGETVALPGGCTWGQRASLQFAGSATVTVCPSPREDFQRPIAGGDMAVSAPGILTFELRGPDNPRWERV